MHGELSGRILGSAIRVHRELGPGLLESLYEECLAKDLGDAGLSVARQVDLPVVFRGETLAGGFRVDLLFQDLVVVEVKSVEALLPLHESQLMTYLRLSRRRLGLLINFNVPRLKDGVLRRVL